MYHVGSLQTVLTALYCVVQGEKKKNVCEATVYHNDQTLFTFFFHPTKIKNRNMAIIVVISYHNIK